MTSLLPSSATKAKRERTSTEDLTIPSGAVLRRFALFVDGMARAMILPFGPRLVFRLVNDSTEITPTSWSAISFQLALVIAAFIVGRLLGTLIAQKVTISSHRLHLHVARLGGAAISLNLFSHGAGLESIFSLIAIRFFSAMVVGLLSGITDPSSLPEDATIDNSQSYESPEKQIDPCSDIASGTAKIYLTGFAVSILSGGLIYRAASADQIFQALTGAYKYTWSPLFLVASTIAGEITLRYAFKLTTQPEHLDNSMGTKRKIRRVVRRIVGGAQVNSNMQRVSFKDGGDPEKQALLGSPNPMRQRTSSAASAFSDKDEFFDCQSEFSDALDGSTHNIFLDDEDIAQYVDKRCVYPDGTPAYVPPGDSPAAVPANYIAVCSGDPEKAERMWRETQQWRMEKNVWKIHTIRNEHVSEIREAYPHFLHGYTKNGLPVVYEQPGRMNLRRLFQGSCTIDDMVQHYTYLQEFLSNCICASDELRRIAGKQSQPYNSSEYGLFVVLDVAGAGISMLSTDVVKYLTRVGAISGAHYPATLKRCCVVNCPFWASSAYSVVKRTLPETVSVELLSADNYVSQLRKYIDDDQIPSEYGGSSPYQLGEHPFEKRLEELVKQSSDTDIEANGDAMVVSSTPHNIGAGLLPATEKEASVRHINEHMDPDHHMRRRTFTPSSDAPNSQSKRDSGAVYSSEHEKVGVDSLAFVSFFCAFWSAAQGGVEIAVPLWLSSPVRFGGLGYSPSWSGVTMFFSALLLFCLLTTRLSRLVSHMPRKDPLRALRIGVGAESVFLCLLASVPIYFDDEKDTTLILSLTTILLALVAFAIILGRASSSVLRRMVADSFADQLPSTRSLNIFNMEHLIADFASGRPAVLLGVIGEVAGVVVISEMWSLSVNRVTPSKYDGSQCLFLPALLAFSLYFVSFFLRLNPDGDFSRSFSSSGIHGSVELGLTSPAKGRRKAV